MNEIKATDVHRWQNSLTSYRGKNGRPYLQTYLKTVNNQLVAIFIMLYYTGMREGELLALTPADIDFEKSMITINKSFQRLNGQDVVSTPKTPKSNRVITIPQGLKDCLKDYISQCYGL